MNYDPKLPDDLKIVADKVNLMWTGDAGLIEQVGFRANLDGELEQKFWPVGGSKTKADGVFEADVFPHLREVFLEELEAEQERIAKIAAEQERTARKQARRAVEAEQPQAAPEPTAEFTPTEFQPQEAPRRGRRKSSKEE